MMADNILSQSLAIADNFDFTDDEYEKENRGFNGKSPNIRQSFSMGKSPILQNRKDYSFIGRSPLKCSSPLAQSPRSPLALRQDISGHDLDRTRGLKRKHLFLNDSSDTIEIVAQHHNQVAQLLKDKQELQQQLFDERNSSLKERELFRRKEQELLSKLEDKEKMFKTKLEEKEKELEELRSLHSQKKVDLKTQREVRAVCKELHKAGVSYKHEEDISSTHNQNILDRVCIGAEGSHIPLSADKIRLAASNNFRHQRDDIKRKITGTFENHRQRQRRNRRLEGKLQSLTLGLEHPRCSLSGEDKRRARELMEKDYMSSDEDEKIKVDGRTVRKVRKLRWLNEEAIRLKTGCHESYMMNVIHSRNKSKLDGYIRDDSCAFSDRPVPRNAPSWALEL